MLICEVLVSPRILFSKNTILHLDLSLFGLVWRDAMPILSHAGCRSATRRIGKCNPDFQDCNPDVHIELWDSETLAGRGEFRVDLSAAGENFQDLESCFARYVSPKFDFQKCSNPFFLKE